MPHMTRKLEKKIKKAPSKPGVYRFLNQSGIPIYIGKANSLKARLRSYIAAGKMGGKVGLMLEEAKDVRWVISNSDIEALILESALIKKHLPRWNVLFRDDKSYFFVHITSDTFPRIYLTHQTQGGGYFIGPFTDGKTIKSALRILREVFPYCTCSEKHARACLNSQIGRCPGYCCLRHATRNKRQAHTEYKSNIENIVKILKGSTKPLIIEMKKRMNLESNNGNYEQAARLRDRIQALESVFKHRNIVEEHRLNSFKNDERLMKIGELLASLFKRKKTIESVEMVDVANIQGMWAVGGLVRFENGAAQKDAYRLFKIRGQWSPHDPRMIAEVLRRRLGHLEWPLPQLMIVDGGKAQLGSAELALKEVKLRNKENIKLLLAALAKAHWELHLKPNKIISLVSLPVSLRHFFERLSSEAHRFTNAYYRKLHRKSYIRTRVE